MNHMLGWSQALHNYHYCNDTNRLDASGITWRHEPITEPCTAHLAATSGTNLKRSSENINRRPKLHDWTQTATERTQNISKTANHPVMTSSRRTPRNSPETPWSLEATMTLEQPSHGT